MIISFTFSIKNPPTLKLRWTRGGEYKHGKEKEEKKEEIIGKLFGVLPIDQLVSRTITWCGIFCDRIYPCSTSSINCLIQMKKKSIN